MTPPELLTHRTMNKPQRLVICYRHRSTLEGTALPCGFSPYLHICHIICFVLFCFCLFVWLVGFFWDIVSLYCPGWPGTHSVDEAGLKLRDPPASASWVLEFKVCPSIIWLIHYLIQTLPQPSAETFGGSLQHSWCVPTLEATDT